MNNAKTAASLARDQEQESPDLPRQVHISFLDDKVLFATVHKTNETPPPQVLAIA